MFEWLSNCDHRIMLVQSLIGHDCLLCTGKQMELFEHNCAWHKCHCCNWKRCCSIQHMTIIYDYSSSLMLTCIPLLLYCDNLFGLTL